MLASSKDHQKSSLPHLFFIVVIAGEHACPPEDCGGIHGYKELLNTLKTPKHPEYRETKVWVGRTFNPTAFSLDACNAELKKLPKYIKEYENGF